MKYKQELKKSFLISFVYVGFGTLSVLSSIPSFPLSGPWAVFGVLLTFPVSIFSFGIAYADSTLTGLILIVESIVFLLFWILLFWYLIRRSKRMPKEQSGLD